MNAIQRKSAFAYARSILDPATERLKVRVPTLVRQAIDSEFSLELPLALHASDVPFKFESPVMQATAEGLMTAVRERVALLVAQAVAERLAAGDAEKWHAAKRRQEDRAEREFDKYLRDERNQTERRARLTRIKQGSIASPRRSASSEALRKRIAAMRLPRIS